MLGLEPPPDAGWHSKSQDLEFEVALLLKDSKEPLAAIA
jgi:hypothetical protein